MTFFRIDQAKQEAYQLAEQTLVDRLNLEFVPGWRLEHEAKLILNNVKQIKKAAFSGIPVDILTQILQVTAQAVSESLPNKIMPEQSTVVEKYVELSSKLQTIRTKASKRLQALIISIVGVILLLGGMALTMMTAGMAFPVGLAIAILVGKIALGVFGVIGMGFGIGLGIKNASITTADADALRICYDAVIAAQLALTNTDDIDSVTSQVQSSVAFGPVWVTELPSAVEPVSVSEEDDSTHWITPFYSVFKEAIDSGYLQNNKKARQAIENMPNGDFSRVFDGIILSDDINQTAYEHMQQQAEKGEIAQHLQLVAQAMSRVFLDTNHRLLPEIKKTLGFDNCADADEKKIVDGLLQAVITLYGQMIAVHNQTILEKSSDKLTDAMKYSYSIEMPLNFYRLSIITADALFADNQIIPSNQVPSKKSVENFVTQVRDILGKITPQKLTPEQKQTRRQLLDSLESVSSKLQEGMMTIYQLHTDLSYTPLQQIELSQIKRMEVKMLIDKLIVNIQSMFSTVNNEHEQCLNAILEAYEQLNNLQINIEQSDEYDYTIVGVSYLNR